MKTPYMKPAFNPVLLPLSGGSGSCYYTVSYAWLECPVEIMPGYAVFGDDNNDCTVEAEDVNICNMIAGHNANVYGS